ncbi:hypothetical protein [Methyloversatilis thermotolerans]|uniref:hypothetical protein n=1 Tax=Methyloversatilis thermotolerans TaxID=1346290 RepID=UPI000378405E|nr:hypothetical protein [Methyloversatilis thermotolerans]
MNSRYGPRMGRTLHVQPKGFLAKLLAVVLTAGLLVLGLMFSVIVVAVALVIGVGLWGWMYWKTRALRRQMRDAMEAAAREGRTGVPPGNDSGGGRVIEGEVISSERERSH